MRRFLIVLSLILTIAYPVNALELTAPEVPEFAEEFMPPEPQNLQEGIRALLLQALQHIRPDLKTASSVCISITAVMMLMSIIRTIPDSHERVTNLAGALAISLLLLNTSGSMINLAADTVRQISEYGKLLLPVMTAALAAQGGLTSSAAIYAGTALFDTLLSSLISSILIPMVYFYLALSVAGCAIGEDMLKKYRDAIKWLMTWVLKTILYIFTGYITVTGVVSGTTDASALKAAKLTISGVVPVVGGILSDASEAILVSAGAVKNTAGIYGLFAVMAIWIGPFLKIGTHYLMFRITGIMCSIFGRKGVSELIQDFSSALGLLLGMTGALCLMLLISLICFMRGVA